MPNRHAFEAHQDGWNSDFEDPAFGPRSSFDFEDELNNLENNMESFNSLYQGLEPSLFADMMCDGEEVNQNFFDGTDDWFPAQSTESVPDQGVPSANAIGMRPNSFQVPENMDITSSSHVFPPSYQSNIVRNREYANERFGQVTPPDDTDSSGFKMPAAEPDQEEDSGKLTRQRRARNAANTRHSKSKMAKQDDNDSGVENIGGSTSRKNSMTVQREKNRVAAAKCRAKKKAGNELVQEEYQQIAADHNDLTRQERELKNERIQLRNLILAHRPGVCACHGIHRYNEMQAQKLVQGHAAGLNSLPSPPARSNSTSASPDSDMQFGSPYPTPSGVSNRMGMQVDRQGSNSQIDHGGMSQGFVDVLHGQNFQTRSS